ncbi:MAG: extracellular solute-binding protein [Ktedonobacteraceae bacterium]|nr:extracellular solute-binding protein [Ktedonobacteraceae bacterium]
MHAHPANSHHSSTIRRFLLFFSLLSLVVMLAACGGSTTPSGTSPSSTTGTTAATCDKSSGLTVYSAQGYDSDATKAFQNQTGITTKLVDDSTGNILAKISAEGANPQWDVTWFDGNVTMQTLDDQGLLLKWHSPATGNLTPQGQSYVPSDGSYYPTGLTTVGAIAYNTKHVPAAGLPQDWQDLLKPSYKNLVAMNDPAFSGPTYPLIAGVSQILGGENQGKQYFQQLKANGLKNFKTNDPTMNSVETGSREFGIVQDSIIYSAMKAGQPIGIIYPKSGVVGLPGVVGVAAKGRHQACAQQFVNWILSSAGQAVMTHHDPTDGDTYFIPVVTGVTPVVSRQTSGFNVITLNVPQWAGVESEYKQWFHDNIVQ